MLTLDKLKQREQEIRAALATTMARVEQMKGALECLAILKKDCEAEETERRAADDDGDADAVSNP